MEKKQQLVNELFKLVALLENSGDFIFTPVGLTVKTYSVLYLISTGINTSRDLLAGMYGSKPNMTKKIKFLEENGFIVRHVDEEDKRVFRFSLTEKSQVSLQKIGPIYERAVDTVFENTKAKDIEGTLKNIETWTKNLLASLENPVHCQSE